MKERVKKIFGRFLEILKKLKEKIKQFFSKLFKKQKQVEETIDAEIKSTPEPKTKEEPKQPEPKTKEEPKQPEPKTKEEPKAEPKQEPKNKEKQKPQPRRPMQYRAKQNLLPQHSNEELKKRENERKNKEHEIDLPYVSNTAPLMYNVVKRLQALIDGYCEGNIITSYFVDTIDSINDGKFNDDKDILDKELSKFERKMAHLDDELILYTLNSDGEIKSLGEVSSYFKNMLKAKRPAYMTREEIKTIIKRDADRRLIDDVLKFNKTFTKTIDDLNNEINNLIKKCETMNINNQSAESYSKLVQSISKNFNKLIDFNVKVINASCVLTDITLHAYTANRSRLASVYKSL